ncbi:MAG: DUF1456 family protein [Salinivirgaceae bacterium]|jgi:uncharacterized protein YehS (DUF1456 family)|nr:DUF1456 family protein [Salinivirgaceae bacterium]
MALTNNDIIKKLRVALQLRDDDIVEILKLVDFRITKSELGAFFRKDDHPNYVEMQDQILRNFLNGLVIYKRGPMEKKPAPKPTSERKSKFRQKPFPRKDKPKE